MPSTYLQTLEVAQVAASRWHIRARFQDLEGRLFIGIISTTQQPPDQAAVDALCQKFVEEHDEREKNVELGQIEEALIEQGRNPFQSLRRVTRAQALKHMLDRHINAPAEKLFRWAHYLDNVTNPELAALGLTAEQITRLRARVLQIKDIRTAMANHDAGV